jgi:hypothetical protein
MSVARQEAAISQLGQSIHCSTAERACSCIDQRQPVPLPNPPVAPVRVLESLRAIGSQMRRR